MKKWNKPTAIVNVSTMKWPKYLDDNIDPSC